MPDYVDEANDLVEHERENMINQARKNAELEPGKPGECELCGEESQRLVKGACAPCRDRHGLP